MTILTLTKVENVIKYGLVRVSNPDGSINREYKISFKELDRINTSGNGLPTGLSKFEWESGLAVVYGKQLDIGDLFVKSDDSLIIKLDEKIDPNGVINDVVLKMDRSDYLGIAPVITVNPLNLVNGISSINLGVIVFDPATVKSTPKSIVVASNGIIN